MALAGVAGGLVSFMLVNPTMAAEEERRLLLGPQEVDPGEMLRGTLLLGLLLGALVGAALTAADELQSRHLRRVGLYAMLGAAVGAICGLIGSVGGEIVFSTLRGGAAAGAVSRPVLIVARAFGWALLGAAAGICPGAVSRSPRRIAQGIAGGLAGGGLGGLLFDTVADITQGGSASRAVGFVLIGALVGALVSLVEEVAKEFWLTALTGTKEGRSFIVAKDVMTLGRSEMADIPLFGDISVQRQHARLLKQHGAIVLMAEPGQAVTVNNRPAAATPLNSGDIIGIGGHRFRFSARRATAHAAQPLPGAELLRSTAGYAMTPVANDQPFSLPPAATAPLMRLEVIGGPHAGAMFPLASGAILGRDPRCDIALVQDGQASRQHARLLSGPDGWYIEDGGSTNGLWVNGQRVVNHRLQPGDQIGIGQTILRVA